MIQPFIKEMKPAECNLSVDMNINMNILKLLKNDKY